MRFVRAIIADGSLDAGPNTCPGFRCTITFLNEEAEVRSFARREDRDRFRMIEARQVPEVAVLSEREFGVGRAHSQTCADEDRDRVRAHGVEQFLAPFGEHRRSLSHRSISGSCTPSSIDDAYALLDGSIDRKPSIADLPIKLAGISCGSFIQGCEFVPKLADGTDSLLTTGQLVHPGAAATPTIHHLGGIEKNE